MKESDKNLEQLIDKMMAENTLQSPSADFTSNLMSQIFVAEKAKIKPYKPLISKVSKAIAPFELIMEIREALGITDFYIADLDAILAGQKNECLYSSLVKEGIKIYLDAGSKNCADLQYLMNMNVFKVVAGLETIESIRELK
mgnify:CR=1 FL=1